MPEFYILFLLFSLLLFSGAKILSPLIKRTKVDLLKLSDVSLVIPFRNEKNNLPILLKSLHNQQQKIENILFVDDHSNDDSALLVEAFVETYGYGKLLELPQNLKGKKSALNYGVSKANTRYILTMDADVEVNENYFESIERIGIGDLTAFPVIMSGNSFLAKLFSTEYTFFNAFSYLWAPIWPISISGANLLFDSSKTDYAQQVKEHSHLASGDDYFLLKKFREKQGSIQMINEFDLSVKTDAPRSLKTYFEQRVRWLGKSTFKMNFGDALMGFFILIYFLGGFTSLIHSAFTAQWEVFIMVFLFRLLLDSLVYLNYAQRLKMTKNVMMLPFFQLLYPLLFFGVMILSVFWKPSWKGRR